jgi:hypothetical protein
MDSDRDKDLDVNPDTDNDGDIDVDDDSAGKPLSHEDNGALGDVKLSHIRAVRIWILARGEREDKGLVNAQTHVVADQRITPKDGIPRRLLGTTIRCRNLGVYPNN